VVKFPHLNYDGFLGMETVAMTNQTSPTVLDLFQRALQKNIDNFETVKTDFIKRFDASPVDAFSLAMEKTLMATMRRDISMMLDDYIGQKRQSRDLGEHLQTDGWIVNDIIKDLTGQVFSKTRNPSRSSSVMTNLIEQTRMMVLSEIIQDAEKYSGNRS
jgi:hypothetical protein